MDYGNLFNRAANIVWQHKFLIVLGFLASLGGGVSSNNNGGSSGGEPPVIEPGQLPQFGWNLSELELSLLTTLLTIAVFIALLVWVVSTTARGGLIAAVDAIEMGDKPGFMEAWQLGWQKVLPLLGIGLLPALPGLVLLISGLLALVVYGNVYGLLGETLGNAAGWTGLGVGLTLTLCLFAPLILGLAILRNFAERACMLEDLGVIAAYRRGAEVLLANWSDAFLLFILQVGLSLLLALLLFLPGIVILLCCLLWPLLAAFQGGVTAFTSALWTLAWRSWTDASLIKEKAPEFF